MNIADVTWEKVIAAILLILETGRLMSTPHITDLFSPLSGLIWISNWLKLPGTVYPEVNGPKRRTFFWH
jgi:hypothetical protein